MVILFWLTQKFNDVSMLLFMFHVVFVYQILSFNLYSRFSFGRVITLHHDDVYLGHFEYGSKTITLEPALSEMLLVHWFQFFYELES